MDTRSAFLRTSNTLFHAMHELATYRIVGNTASLAILSVHVEHKDTYTPPDTPAIAELRSIGALEYNVFRVLSNESAIVLAVAWLDTFLSEVEEVLFLDDPTSLGESVQIKLGKVLSCSSLQELIHDLARRRTREKGQWSLKSRVSELRDRYSLSLNVSEQDLNWLAELRNALVHDRRVGEFKTVKGKIQYAPTNRRHAKALEDVRRCMSISFSLMAELYVACSVKLGITRRFPSHRSNLKFITGFDQVWSTHA
jgi:hypothetical protein